MSAGTTSLKMEESNRTHTKQLNTIYYNLRLGETVTISRRESERRSYTSVTGKIVYINKNIFILSLKNKRESFSRFDLLDGSVVIEQNGM